MKFVKHRIYWSVMNIFKFINRDTEIFTYHCNLLYKSFQRNPHLRNPYLKMEFIDGYTTNLF